MTMIEIAAATGDLCGESPAWDPRTGRVHWVDILGQRVHALDAATGEVVTHRTDDFPTALGLCRTPGLGILAMAGGVRLIDLATGETRPFARLDEPEGNRLNEGAVGPDGAFWVGTMQSNIDARGDPIEITEARGALWRVGPGGKARRITPPMFGIANTLAWDVGRGRLFIGDTLAAVIYNLPWPLSDPAPKPEPFSVIGEPGLPDGSEIDETGHLWTARYGGGAVLRIGPDGHVAQRIDLPARNPTDAVFGGTALDVLYVTSAAAGLPTSQEGPHQGALLSLKCRARGRAPYLFEDGGAWSGLANG